MGKRKRRADQNKTPPPPPPPDLMRYGFCADALCEKKSSNSVDNSAIKPPSSTMDIMNSSMKVSNVQHSHAHHHHNHSGAMLLRHPHYFYGHHYSRRNSANHAETSTSRGKGALHDEQSSSKLASLCKSDSGCHTESWDKFFRRPERVSTSSLAMDAVAPDVGKMQCGVCQKRLRRKPCILGNTLSSGDVSVVAVLVCGHVYHADCLEQRTCHEDRRDPVCPLCLSLLTQVDR